MITTQSMTQVESLLAQMRAAARAAQGPAGATDTPAAAAGAGDFASRLADSLGRVSETQNLADLQARRFTLGESPRALSDVMIDLQKANLSFQTAVQVRNRLVEAYKEIASMAI